MDILCLHAKFGGDMPLHGGVRKKSCEFCIQLPLTMEYAIGLTFGGAVDSEIPNKTKTIMMTTINQGGNSHGLTMLVQSCFPQKTTMMLYAKIFDFC